MVTALHKSINSGGYQNRDSIVLDNLITQFNYTVANTWWQNTFKAIFEKT